jgi:hypothetical protein
MPASENLHRRGLRNHAVLDDCAATMSVALTDPSYPKAAGKPDTN